MKIKPKIVIVAVIVLLVLIILFQNVQAVPLTVLFWELSMSKVILIPLVLIIGFILGFISAKTVFKKKL